MMNRAYYGYATTRKGRGLCPGAEAALIAGVGRNQAQLVGVRQMPQLVEQFLKLKPPRFPGCGDPEAVPRSVEELKKTFKILGCNDEEKGTLAVCQLQDDAND